MWLIPVTRGVFAVMLFAALADCSGGGFSPAHDSANMAPVSPQNSNIKFGGGSVMTPSRVLINSLPAVLPSRFPVSKRIRAHYAKDVGRALYVSNYFSNTVLEYVGDYKKTTGPSCTISGLNYPTGMTTDQQGNLYVTNNNYGYAPSSIYVYAPDCGSQIANVTDPYGPARAIAVNGSTWYVANQYGVGSSTASVAICTASGCDDQLTAPSPGFGELLGVALDSKGNVYGSGFRGNYPQLVEWRQGRMPGKVLRGFFQQDPGTIQFDDRGDLASLDIFLALRVYWGCAHYCKQKNNPSILKNPGYSSDFVLNRANEKIYVADQKGSVDVYKYKFRKGVSYLYSITAGLSGAALPSYVTTYPPSLPGSLNGGT